MGEREREREKKNSLEQEHMQNKNKIRTTKCQSELIEKGFYEIDNFEL